MGVLVFLEERIAEVYHIIVKVKFLKQQVIFEKFSISVGIDLGTVNTLAGVPGRGVVFNEPTVVARQKKKLAKPGRIICLGKRAKQMIGRQPRQVMVIEPIIDGAIADFDATVSFLNYLIGVINELPSTLPRFLKPRAIFGVSSGITEVEKRAVRSAALTAGFGKVSLVEAPMAAAIGAGLKIDTPVGNLLIDIGGGVTEIAIISLGGIVLSRFLRVGGKDMDEAIVNFVRLKYGVLIGEQTAEKIKTKIGSVLPFANKKEKSMIAKGRDLETGLPKTVELSSREVREALSPIIQQLLAQLSELLEETPPEISVDIQKRGIVLTGGSSQLPGLERLISEVAKTPVWVAKNPDTSVVNGCVKLFENKELLSEVELAGGFD